MLVCSTSSPNIYDGRTTHELFPCMKHPSIVCYRSSGDLSELKSWFYDFLDVKDDRVRAIKRVRALSTRGKLPHGLESTALLTSVHLQDRGNGSPDTNVLRLSYAMALIRFVNGLLDPLQQSNYAIPLHTLAKSLNLPSFFVELRHMGTHELLPSLHMLRIACNRALTWLYDNYWSGIDLVPAVANDDATPTASETAIRDETMSHLKTYKSIRKENLDMVYKFGNSSDTGSKYWAAVKALKSTSTNLLASTLVEGNFMFANKSKSKKQKLNSQLIKLYKPLFKELGLDFQVDILIAVKDAAANGKVPPEHARGWCEAVLNMMVQDSSKDSLWDISKKIEQGTQNLKPQEKFELLSLRDQIFLATSMLLPESQQKMEKQTAEAKRQAELAQYSTPSLEDILGVTENQEAKASKANPPKRQRTTVRLFEPILDWTPTPFGRCK